MTDFELFLLLGGLLLILLIILCIIYNERTFDLSKASWRCSWVRKGYENFCKDIIAVQFKNEGKEIYTKAGHYRANFLKASNKFFKKMEPMYFNGEALSFEFSNFIRYNYDKLKVKNFSRMCHAYYNYNEKNLYNKHENFLSSDCISPVDFFEIRKKQKGDIVGVYILHNVTKNMFYVGQATRLFMRINQHFTGKGNGDVYADYKYGDIFNINIIPLTGSGYSDLDLLEKTMIAKYDAYNSGYNKTNGNG